MDTVQTDQELFEKEFNINSLSMDEIIEGDKEVPLFLSEWLRNGLNTTRLNEQTGKKVPDYKVRLEFQRILGKLLGF